MTDTIYNFKDSIETLSYEEIVQLSNVITNKVIVSSNLAQGSKITDAKVSGILEVVAGEIHSANYVLNTSGWRLTPTSGEFNFNISTDSLEIGTSPNWLKVDTDGNLWLGNATLAGAQANTIALLKTGVAYLRNIVISGLAAGSAVDLQYATNVTAVSLSALSANLGTITAGNITLDSSGFIRCGATGYLTGTGFWLGYDTSDYKLHIGNPAGSYMSWDGTTLKVVGKLVQATGLWSASDDLIITNSTTRITVQETYTKIKGTTISFSGTLRIKMRLNSSGGGGVNVYARIYRNGSAVGTERITTTTRTDTEDIAGWEAGDEIQIYGKTANSAITGSNIDLFEIYGLPAVNTFDAGS